MIVAKKEYIKSRTEYYRKEYKGTRMTKAQAEECAERDWGIYCEKYGQQKQERGD